jgi:hypothetical protein
VQFRSLVPSLAVVVAFGATAQAETEVAKGVTIGGWVVVTSTTTRKKDAGTATDREKDAGTATDFDVAADVKLGWKVNDQVSAKLNVRSRSSDGINENGAYVLEEAYITTMPSPEFSLSAGKSYGPIGWVAAEPTGMLTVTAPLNASYGKNPVGVWGTFAPSSQFNGTVLVSDGINGGSATKAAFGNKSNKKQGLGVALDAVFMPTAELALNAEAAFDPSGTENDELVSFYGLNATFTKDQLTLGAEGWMRKGKEALGSDDSRELAVMGLVNYKLPDAPKPMAVTLAVSYGKQRAIDGVDVVDNKATKVQAVLLSNPFVSSNFGLNLELFLLNQKPGNGGDKVNTYGLALEALASL